MPTHIIEHFESQDLDYLFRAESGIRLAQRHQVVVIIGENPNKAESKVFISPEMARKYIRETMPSNDGMASANVLVEVREMEGRIALPAGAMDLNYSPHRMKN